MANYYMDMEYCLPSAYHSSAPMKAVGAILMERGKDIYVNNDESIILCIAYSSIWHHNTSRDKVDRILRSHHPFPNEYYSVIRATSREQLSLN